MRWVAGSVAMALAVFLAGSVLAQGGAAKVDWKVGPSEGGMYEVYPIEAGLRRGGALMLEDKR